MLIFNGKKYFIPLFNAGMIPDYDGSALQGDAVKGDDNNVAIQSFIPEGEKFVVKNLVNTIVPLWQFGNAEALVVPKGYFFTSMDGFRLEGEMPIYDYSPLAAEYSDETDNGFIFMTSVGSNTLMEDEINLEVPKDVFGNAKTSEVFKGRFFTSEDGVMQEGTYEPVSIDTCTVDINIVDAVGNIGATATQFANGAVTTFRQSKSSGTFIIPNVVCGSIITIVCNSYFSINGWTNGGQVGLTSLALIAPNTTGDYSANIIAYDD